MLNQDGITWTIASSLTIRHNFNYLYHYQMCYHGTGYWRMKVIILGWKIKWDLHVLELKLSLSRSCQTKEWVQEASQKMAERFTLNNYSKITQRLLPSYLHSCIIFLKDSLWCQLLPILLWPQDTVDEPRVKAWTKKPFACVRPGLSWPSPCNDECNETKWNGFYECNANCGANLDQGQKAWTKQKHKNQV